MIRSKMKPLGFLTVSVFCLLCLVGTHGFADQVLVQSTWIPGPSTPPIIDGTLNAGEWLGAGLGLLPVAGNILVKNDTSTLYMILDFTGDNVEDAVPMEDSFRLTVDVKADTNIEPNVDVQFMMDPSSNLGLQYYLGPNSFTALTPALNSQVGVGFGGSPIVTSPSHRVWELAIGFDDIGITPDIWTSGSTPMVRVGVRFISTNPDLIVGFPAGFETDFTELITIYLGYPSIPVDPSAPGLKGVGHIPRSNIIDGYADTSLEPDPILRVKDAPFGGTIDVKGDFAALIVNGAVQYKIEYSKDGGPYQAFTQTWTNYRWDWDGSKYTYIANTIKPDANDKYDCLPEPLNDWYWNDLVLRWKTQSFGNGLYTLIITAYDSGDAVISSISGTTLTLVIDNTPPQVEIKEVYHYVGSSEVTLPDCGIVTINDTDPTDGLRFRIKALEDEGHLLHYYMKAHYADNKEMDAIPEDYYYKYHPVTPDPKHVDEDGPHLWNGEMDLVYPPISSDPWKPDTAAEFIGQVCGYQFRLSARSRTINGYHRLFYREYNRHACIKVE